MGDILAGVSSTASAPMSAQREVNGPNIKEIWRASGEVFVVQYGVGRQPCRCAQINSLIEFSHAVSMQPTISRLLQLKIYRTSTRSRCTCTRVHVSTRQDTRFIYEYSTSCTRPIRKKSILKMYRYTKRTKVRPRYSKGPTILEGV